MRLKEKELQQMNGDVVIEYARAVAAREFLSMVYLSIRTWDPDETYGR